MDPNSDSDNTIRRSSIFAKCSQQKQMIEHLNAIIKDQQHTIKEQAKYIFELKQEIKHYDNIVKNFSVLKTEHDKKDKLKL